MSDSVAKISILRSSRPLRDSCGQHILDRTQGRNGFEPRSRTDPFDFDDAVHSTVVDGRYPNPPAELTVASITVL